ncbi:MAG: DnaD domain protein [Clostridia bacterium]
MSFCKFGTEKIFNNKIEVDNIFINEFMPEANAEAVKVYLYGLYMCGFSDTYDNDIAHFASVLSLSEQDVLDSFLYWEEKGIVQILNTYPKQIRYMPLTNCINLGKKYSKTKFANFNIQSQEIIKGRDFTPNEFKEYYDLIEAFHMEEEALLMIMAYCVKIKGDKVGHPYVTTVAKNWAREGILSAEQVEERLKTYELQTDEIKDVLKSMGKDKKATAEDFALFNKWKNDYGYLNGDINYVAKQLKLKKKRTSFELVDDLLTKYYEMKLLSIKEIEEYENAKNSLFVIAKQITKNMGLYYESLETIIDSYISVWIGKGYDDETLKLISTFCFKKSIRTLDGMDKIIQKLYKLGIVSIEAFKQHIKQLSQSDEEIKEVLTRLGIERFVNSYDREFFNTWTSTWGISKELLDYGISLAAQKNAPMQYLNKLFSKWHEKNIKTKAEAEKLDAQFFVQTKKPQEESGIIKKEYSKEQLNALFDSLEEIDL